MNEQIEVLERERNSLQKQLETVETAFEKFKSDPEMSFEATKAGKDTQTLKGLIKEIEEKIRVLTESERNEELQNEFPTREGMVIEMWLIQKTRKLFGDLCRMIHLTNVGVSPRCRCKLDSL